MYVVLVLLGIGLILFGLFHFMKLAVKILHFCFVWTKLTYFSSEKQVDSVYMEKVLSKEEDYKQHEIQTDQVIDEIINKE